MTWLRHDVAHWFTGLGTLALGAILPFALACSPLQAGTLGVEGESVSLIEGERHLVIRFNARALEESRSSFLDVTVPAEGVDSVVLLPDDPELTGVSVGGSFMAVRLNPHMDLGDRLSTCEPEGMCEIGMTIIVVPNGEEAPATEVSVTVRAVTDTEEQFSADATIELEVDGETPVLAERSFP